MKNGLMRRKRLGITIISTALIALLLVTACGPAPAPPTGDKVVEVGCLVALTGPVGGASSYAFYAMQDYLEYFNDQDSIPGVEIDLVWTDTATVDSREISAYNRFIARGIPIIMTVIDSEKFVTWTARDKTPMIALAQTEDIMYPPSWMYSIYPTWAESFYVWCQWIMKNWKEGEAPKVVLMGPDTVAGPPAILPAKSYVESLGIELMAPEYTSGYAPMDTSTQLLRAHSNGADYVYILPIWSLASIVLKDAERLKLIDKMHFGGLENTQGTRMVQQLGDVANGYSAPRNAPWIEEMQVPGIELIHDWRKEYGRPYDFAGDDSNGTVTMAVACEAVRRAVAKVGTENLDGIAIKEAMDSFRDWDVYEIKQITYTAEDHRGWNKARIYEVRDGDVIPLSDWIVAPMIMPGELR